MEGAHAEGHLGDVIVALTAESPPYCHTEETLFGKPKWSLFYQSQTHKSNKSFHLVTIISTSHLKILRIN